MRKILIATTVAAALVSGAAIAKPGAYVGLNLGYGMMDTPKDISANGQTLSNTENDRGGLAGGIVAGYLWGQSAFNYGIEVGAHTYQNSDASATLTDGSTPPISTDVKATYKGYNIDLLAVGKYNLTPNWNIFGKAGAAYVHQKTTVESSADGTILDKSKGKLLPKAAVGVGYTFNNGVGLNLAYSHIFGSKPNQVLSHGSQDDMSKVASVDMLTFGVSYTF